MWGCGRVFISPQKISAIDNLQHPKRTLHFNILQSKLAKAHPERHCYIISQACQEPVWPQRTREPTQSTADSCRKLAATRGAVHNPCAEPSGLLQHWPPSSFCLISEISVHPCDHLKRHSRCLQPPEHSMSCRLRTDNKYAIPVCAATVSTLLSPR
jgi:hypothetical protein